MRKVTVGQLMETIAGTVVAGLTSLRDTFESRFKKLEDELTATNQRVAASDEMRLTLETNELTRALDEACARVEEERRAIEESNAATAASVADRLKKLDDRALEVTVAQVELAGQIRAAAQARDEAPSLQDIVASVVASLKMSEAEAQSSIIAIVDSKLGELRALTESLSKDSALLTDRISTVEAALHSEPSVAEQLRQATADIHEKSANLHALCSAAMQSVSDESSTTRRELAEQISELKSANEALSSDIKETALRAKESIDALRLSCQVSDDATEQLTVKLTQHADAMFESLSSALTAANEEIASIRAVVVSLPRAADIAKEAAAMVPQPRDGEPGKSFTIEEARGVISELIAELKMPTAAEVAESLDGNVSRWALDFERRAQDLLQGVIARMPAPKDGQPGKDGKDGKDGFSLKDFSTEVCDDGRVLRFKFDDGQRKEQRDVPLVKIEHVGFYKEDTLYRVGQMLTNNGSVFMALRDTKTKPETEAGAADWRLIVKRGRDGKQGLPGPRGPAGEVVKGKPLVTIDPSAIGTRG